MKLEDKWKPILVGGLIIGMAPFVPFLNLTCCLIPISGGIAAVAVFRNSRPDSFTSSDGLLLGAMSGLFGTAIYAVLLIPLALVFSNALGGLLLRLTPTLPDIPESLHSVLRPILSHLGSIVGFILFLKLLGHLAMSLIFGMLGGVLGIALFRSGGIARRQE